MSQRHPDEIVREARRTMEGLALKIVRQTWLLLGETPTQERTARAKLRIETELHTFLVDTAKWVLDEEAAKSERRGTT